MLQGGEWSTHVRAPTDKSSPSPSPQLRRASDARMKSPLSLASLTEHKVRTRIEVLQKKKKGGRRLSRDGTFCLSKRNDILTMRL